MDNRIWIGVDGGGTHTSAIALNERGHMVAEARGGALNFLSSSMEASRTVLRQLIAELQSQTGAEVVSVHVGTTALDDEADHETILALSRDIVSPETFTVTSDLRAALFALTQGASGVMLVCGTGLMGAAFSLRGEMKLCGGWGYALSDEGSCFYMGQQGLLAAVHEMEGRGEPTTLGKMACDFFGTRTLREVIPLLYVEGTVNERVASFARVVIDQAKKAERVSWGIVQSALRVQVSVCTHLLHEAGLSHEVVPVGVYGGFFQHHPEFIVPFREALNKDFPQAVVQPLRIPPAVGAILDGVQRLRPLGWQAFSRNILRAYGKNESSLKG